MSNKMLIDATHPEETRVVVLRGNRVEEFDFEAADRQQLRGNIYLAKVTRVEPSLQAAFVDYGGNRHGFLAFSEIHPDYYQIPYADRQALLQAQAREDEEEAAEEAAAADEAAAAEEHEESAGAEGDPAAMIAASADEASAENVAAAAEPGQLRSAEDAASGAADDAVVSEEPPPGAGVEEVGDAEHDAVESVGAEDALEEVSERRKPRPRQYKIQEVIKRRQVLLVQVVKEERGNKGAALTTYLSLAGRYSVLMPNTGRGGGISRKITNPADRKRLKAIASELDVPEGMGVILRTAGANRTKAEVKRDFEYLLRLWENVRELTLKSSAPKLVYEEGSLIKRSIRDLYSKEIEQVVVAGDDAYREAKDFMRMLMPSHAKNVQQYRDDTPIFARNGVEAQLDAMFSPQVTLRSGGYIVINQTEALVSIDVNSGRSTREHSIEDTALNTNTEAAEEVARQLRLRDLAGLIVIDFIDMEEKRNNRSVERKLKDCLRADRARIQVGRISHFGLLEMSRQRIRTGVLESSMVACPHCRGTGHVRSVSSLALQILRAVEDQLLRNSGFHLFVNARPEVALYVLNQKRLHLAQLEARFGVAITVGGEPPENGAGFSVERGGPVEDRPERAAAPAIEAAPMPEYVEAEEDEIEPESEREEASAGEREEASAGEGRERRPRRRRRGRRANGDDRHERSTEAGASLDGEVDAEGESGEPDQVHARPADDDEGSAEARRRRRGRRGGRRRGRGRENGDQPRDDAYAGEQRPEENFEAGGQPNSESASGEGEGASYDDAAPAPEAAADSASGDVSAGFAPESASASWRTDAYTGEPEPEAEARRETGEAGQVREPEPPIDAIPSRESAPEPEPVPPPPPVEDNRPKRSGWWNRKSFF